MPRETVVDSELKDQSDDCTVPDGAIINFNDALKRKDEYHDVEIPFEFQSEEIFKTLVPELDLEPMVVRDIPDVDVEPVDPSEV